MKEKMVKNLTNYKIITKCEVCDSSSLTPILDLGQHPLCDDLIPIGNSSECTNYPIEILYCDRCNTAHQRMQVTKKILFPSTYHYRSRFTADVLSGMSALVEACESQLGSLKDKKILDIGCNDGSLLNFFRAKGAVTIGIEPTDAVHDAKNKGHDLTQGYFDILEAEKILSKHGELDVITFTNVFAHIENLPQLLEALKKLMSEKTTLVIENHYLGAVLDGFQFDTFYHEHPRTYSLTSFKFIAEAIGFDLIDAQFPQRYGGNIRVFIGKEKKSHNEAYIKSILIKENFFIKKLILMQSNISRWQEITIEKINIIVKKEGPMRAKAFPGRAAILIKMLNLNAELVEAAYEKPGSMKIGNYIPGTRIPIKSDDELFADINKNAIILNFAWHIDSEIINYLRSGGFKGEVINILDPKLAYTS